MNNWKHSMIHEGDVPGAMPFAEQSGDGQPGWGTPYVQYMYSYPHKTAYRPLPDIRFQDYAHYLAGNGHSLYLHIPFCETKCGYCNLFSVTGQGEEEMERYLKQVGRQLCQYQEILALHGTEFGDFTIGGGTPLLLSERQLERMFSMVRQGLSFSRTPEILIETAPNQTTREKLKVLKEAGVTRVSMGIQSFFDAELQVLGRRHSAGRAKASLERLMSFDFPRVNVDFIYGIPGQTINTLLASLKEALTYEPGEIFLYPLYVKHGAGMERQLGTEMVMDSRLAFSQYQEAAAFLQAENYRQDSMRRFVRKEKKTEAAHALDLERAFQDCGFSTSLSLGCGGRSYLGELHFCTPYAITRDSCLGELRGFEATEDFSKIRHGILLSGEERRRRYVIRHLLIHPGLPAAGYQAHFGLDPAEDFPVIKEWMEKGYVVYKNAFFRLSPEGMALSDYLGPQLISPWIRKRMEEWDREHQRK